MAGSMSDYLENEILDHVLGGADYTRPATVYIALYTATPSDAGGGTECSGGSYARKSVTNNDTNFPAATGGAKTTGAAVTFVTATGDWGTVTQFGIFDALTGGNLLYWGDLTAPKVISSGDTAQFASGAITITQG